jgi:phosphoglycolate phosphatase
VDSVPDLCATLNEVLGARGHAPLEPRAVARMVGDGTPTLLERGFAARGGDAAEAKEALPQFLAIYEKNAANLTRPYPGVAATLRELRGAGYRTAICTNKPQRATLAVLRALDLAALFDGIAGGDRYAVKKPDPGHLLALIAELGGTVERSAMVGDHENDAAAAHAAAVKFVLMRYGYARGAPDDIAADARLDHFGDLPQALTRLDLVP